MSSKNNIRSFRYSDQVAEILESFEGDSLNAKFENLVQHCYHALPELDTKISLYEDYLKQTRDQLHQCQNRILFLNDTIRELERIQAKLTGVTVSIDDYMDRYQEGEACSSNGSDACYYCDKFVLHRGDSHDNRKGI